MLKPIDNMTQLPRRPSKSTTNGAGEVISLIGSDLLKSIDHTAKRWSFTSVFYIHVGPDTYYQEFSRIVFARSFKR